MTKRTGNVFVTAPANRKAEQESIEQDIKESEKLADRDRPPKKNAERSITVNIRMSEETKTKLKVYAASNNMTVSEVITEFVNGLEE